MDQMENEEKLPAPQLEPDETVAEETCQDVTASGDEPGIEPAVAAEDSQDEPMAEPTIPEEALQEKRRSGKIAAKIGKIAVSALFVVALVATACYVSIRQCNRYWQAQYHMLWLNMYEKNAALQQQIDSHKDLVQGSGSMTDPAGNLSASEIYQQNVNSVVAISSTIRVEEGGKVLERNGAGTGFIITSDGYIVTNHHVIDGATKITVTLHDGAQLPAMLIGADATNDVAVIKVMAGDLDPVTIGSSSRMQVGDQVLAIGNALGQFNSSLTVGYISGMNRGVSTDGTVINMIQTDAAINSGNSGGPLFNAKGEVIGITTAKYSGTSSSGATIEGIGFAIPMDDVIDMIEDLRDFGYIRSAFLGVMVWEVDPKIALTYNLPLGVYVEDVTPGYCSEKAGIQAKDIIVELGGYRIKTMNDLSRALRAIEPGTTVTVVVWRAGQQIVLPITLDEKPVG